MSQQYQTRPIGEFVLHPRNPRQGDLGAIAESIERNGWYGAVITQKSTGYVIAGNHRVMAARQLGFTSLPTFELDVDDATAMRIMLADNRSSDRASNDEGILAQLLQEIAAEQGDLAGTLYDGDDLDALLADIAAPGGEEARPALADRFVVPPFSVLDTRQGYWQVRKRQWLAYGLRSELGRGELPQAKQGSDERFAAVDNARAAYAASNVTGERQLPDWADNGTSQMGVGTSIFDPVLCEVAYRWFTPPAGRVLDPFAGGSVRGIVAGVLGRTYTGIDLSAEQVAANQAQAQLILTTDAGRAEWVLGDAAEVLPTMEQQYDLVFTCPPYYGMERYTDDPRDLSAMPTSAFDEAFAAILAGAVRLLHDDSFAMIVATDVRDEAGTYRPLADRTTEIMARLGLGLYNRAVLVNSIGTLPIRVARMFTSARKLGRTHQDVLVFVKGDPRRAAERCGDVEVTVEEPAT